MKATGHKLRQPILFCPLFNNCSGELRAFKKLDSPLPTLNVYQVKKIRKDHSLPQHIFCNLLIILTHFHEYKKNLKFKKVGQSTSMFSMWSLYFLCLNEQTSIHLYTTFTSTHSKLLTPVHRVILKFIQICVLLKFKTIHGNN